MSGQLDQCRDPDPWNHSGESGVCPTFRYENYQKKNLFLIAETAGPGEGRQNIQLGAAGSYFRADLSGLDSAVRGEGGRTAL